MSSPNREEVNEILRDAKRIAVVGLSDNPTRTSYQVTEALLAAGYEIIPVNPVIEEVFGRKAVSSVTDIEGDIDIVNVFRRTEFLPEIAEETAKTNAKVFWSQLGLASDEAEQIALKAGKKVVMDRCIKIELAYLNK
ncbi:CoA-binding protein [Salipaludibacillus neizhouensis]|uniref:CoA-binding protein n=1 Tax=Salipaludibacillus neizhouensis TaxID=885475 RepID=A0A3A9KMT1_9BACI|nr:CoA-binding protein [Salipaludibacillus neizhouensis]RKL69215.1 CoA-binding protein [Salipaludibacillus neizhouensis]